MREPGSLMRLLSLITVFCFVTSCGGLVPERFATVTEVYPPNSLPPSQADLPPGTTVKATFAAPYVDVFRAVMVGATQAQFNIEIEDKAKGIILATRVLSGRAPTGNMSTTHKYYYGIVLKETGPKSTEVQVVAKRQISCHKNTFGIYFISIILIILVVGIVMVSAALYEDSVCDEFAQVQLATGKYSGEEQMAQLITFTRNNLIAAGAL